MARRTRPDVLIVDVHLPDLDGLSLCSRLLESNQPGIDVIVVSGYSTSIRTAARISGRTSCARAPRSGPRSNRAAAGYVSGNVGRGRGRGAATRRDAARAAAVLVIDDDPHIGRFLGNAAAQMRRRRAVRDDGWEGYHVAAREKPAVILSDYFMPVATINFLLWQLRSTPALERISVLAMSGKTLDRTTAESLMKGDFGGAASSGSSRSRSTSTSCSPR